MASVRNVSGYDLEVPELYRIVPDGETATIPDDRWQGYVSQAGVWEGVDEPATPADELAGQSLDAALTDAGLPKTGTADDKRQRLADWQAEQSQPTQPTPTDPEGS